MKKEIKSLAVAFALGVAAAGCKNEGSLADNAEARKPADFPELAEDVFQPMDGGIALTPDEIGRASCRERV